MHRVFRKRIRRNEDGVDVAVDVDAVIAINAGANATSSRSLVHSSHTVVQGTGARRSKPDRSPPDSDDPSKEKP
ncbi:MAG: hypothetical protein QOJ35_3621 [Solirubrobacteraceae bacterium]|jgi:hypothetical protein|nr:hypothetical protein [Solirubrobacteraceae bacterium]